MSIKKLYEDLIEDRLNFFKNLKELIGTGFDINTKDEDGMSLLHRVVYAFRYNDELEKEVIKHLIKNGADVNNARPRSNWTPLFNAIMPISVAKVQVLLENGANPNVRDSDGATPLFRAMQPTDEHYEVVKLLLKYGADPNIPYSSGEFPINRVKEKRFRDLYTKK